MVITSRAYGFNPHPPLLATMVFTTFDTCEFRPSSSTSMYGNQRAPLECRLRQAPNTTFLFLTLSHSYSLHVEPLKDALSLYFGKSQNARRGERIVLHRVSLVDGVLPEPAEFRFFRATQSGSSVTQRSAFETRYRSSGFSELCTLAGKFHPPYSARASLSVLRNIALFNTAVISKPEHVRQRNTDHSVYASTPLLLPPFLRESAGIGRSSKVCMPCIP